MKICKTCGQEKAIDDYYKKRSVCKACVRLKTKDHYHANADKYRAGREKKRESLSAKSRQHYSDNKEKAKQTARNYRVKNSELLAVKAREYRNKNKAITKAHGAIRWAKESGQLVPDEACWHCGSAPTEGHHCSYAEDMRLAVTWLCGSCHRTVHAEHSRR